MTPVLLRRPIEVIALAMALIVGIVGVPIATAAGSLAEEEAHGRGLAESVRSGELRCNELSADDIELIGEYAMGRYLGSEGAHARMNRRMTVMMGEAGERRMHIALGRRYSGCSGGPATAWVGPMAGMMSGHGFNGSGPGMMRGAEYEEQTRHPGAMMGDVGNGDGDISGVGVALIALAAAALSAGIVALSMHRRGPRDRAAR
jgi:hypothetical protein